MVERLERVLNETVEEHQHNLRALNLCLVKMNLESYSMLPGYQVCIELVAALNESIQASNGTVKSKIDNPYEPQIVSGFMIREYAEQLTEALAQLEKERVEHNDVPKKTNRLIAELKKINGEIAYYDVIELSKQFDKQQEEFEKAKKLRDKSKVAYEASKKTVEGLQAQRNNVHLAVEAINSCFKYIFFAENRLRIEFVDGVYKLFSNGKSVKPSDVSMGERSIIALSYFFTSIFEGREEVDAYKPECLLVIDDPVCSYDIENRIGILSFLKYKLSMHLEGNINTKVLVMTHDLPTFYDIHKLLEEIVESCKSQGYANTPKFNRFELRDKLLMPFSYKKRQEYTELIEMVYKYATGQVSNYDFVIGNMMRQVLEAFSTFEYKKGIEGVSTDAQILSLLPSIEYVSYYKNLMYRLVLHGGSHKEEQVKTMSDFNFFALISELEKRRTAKDVLCFIYLLNKRHLLEHLKACGDVESELDSWCEDIKQRAVVV